MLGGGHDPVNGVNGTTLFAPIDPAQNRETVSVQSTSPREGGCFPFVQTEDVFIAVEPVIFPFTPPFALVEIEADSNLKPHTHTYKTGKRRWHNRVPVETSPPNLP